MSAALADREPAGGSTIRLEGHLVFGRFVGYPFDIWGDSVLGRGCRNDESRMPSGAKIFFSMYWSNGMPEVRSTM